MSQTNFHISNHSGHTGLLCLLGDPVSHSISPAMHNLAFSELGLDLAYLAFTSTIDELEDTVASMKRLGARGWNLTYPVKNKMATLCDHLSPAASIIGAVNTVVNENGVLTGHTTDGIGYMRAAADAGYNMVGKRVTMLGAGGAAVSILVQAALDGVSHITVFNNRSANFTRMETIMEQLRQQTSCTLELYDYSDMIILKEQIHQSDFLINTTPVGMAPDLDGCLIPDASYLHDNLVVSDIIYNPRKTRLLTMAEEAGLDTFNGMYMLLYQGAEAFRLWTGQDMPVDVIKKAYFE